MDDTYESIKKTKLLLENISSGMLPASSHLDTDMSGVILNGKTVDVSSIEIDGVDSRDYPDFADAYVHSAKYTDGTELTDSELDQLRDENPDLVHQMAHEMHETVDEASWSDRNRPRRGDNVQCGINTTIERNVDGEEIELDVYIEYDAVIANPGYAQTYDDPGEASEWEFDITDITLDLPKSMDVSLVGGPLTPEEKSHITKWFEDHASEAAEIADDKYEPGSYHDYEESVEEGQYPNDHLASYKAKNVQGLYNYNHYEHPDGSFLQIRHGKPFLAVHQCANGDRKEFADPDEVRSHVNAYHNAQTESNTTDNADEYLSRLMELSGIDEGKADNFTIDDIKHMESMRDLEQMKMFAKNLIATPSTRPMKPQKVAWLSQSIDSKKTPAALIKLMYDLLLGGEGFSVIGSRYSTDPNSYQRTFSRS